MLKDNFGNLVKEIVEILLYPNMKFEFAQEKYKRI